MLRTKSDYATSLVLMVMCWSTPLAKKKLLSETMLAQPKTDSFTFNKWTFDISESHILKSEGAERESFEATLTPLPQTPEMTFDRNILRVRHTEGFGVEFSALDALKLVDAENDVMKVSMAEVWKSTRSSSEHVHDVFKPFDWTFTTSYKGTLLGDGEKTLTVMPTTDKINYDQLRVEEKILFFASLILFEDELADNGASILSLKMRAMNSGYFILLRFYLRVDNVLVRVHDTRLHYEYNKNYILREYSVRESAYADINAPVTDITDTNQVVEHLPLVSTHTEKLVFPPLDS